MVRIALGTIVGIVLAFAVIEGRLLLSLVLLRVPDGLDWTGPTAHKTLTTLIWRTWVLDLAGWGLAALIGGSAAAAIARRPWTAWVVAILVLADSVTSMVMLLFPYPLWFKLGFVLCSVLVCLVPAWLAGRMMARPKPYSLARGTTPTALPW